MLRRLLVVLAAEAATVSTLVATGPMPAWAGLHHHVALPPFDLFADVRVLVARAPDGPAFVAGIVLVGAGRTAVLAAALGGPHRRTLRRAAPVYGVALPVAVVAGVLAHSGVALLYSVFVWAGAALAVVAGVALAPWPWPTPRRLVAVAAVAGFTVVLLLLSAVSATAPAAGRVGLVWVTAAVAIVAVQLATVPGRDVGGRATASTIGAATALALVAALVPAVPPAPGVPVTRSGSLFLVPGVGGASGVATMFELDPTALGFGCEQTSYFSYAGSGNGAPQQRARCPIRTGAPYSSDDTRRPFADLVETFRAQVADLPPPVVVVTHSQGAWIAVEALAGSPVEALAMLAPFPEHPWGYGGPVGAWGMRALVSLLRRWDATRFDPDGPLPAEMLATTGRIDEVLAATPRAAERAFALSSAFDLPLMPDGGRVPGAADACPIPVHHGSLPTSDRAARLVARFLDGEDVSGCPWWRRFPYRAGAAFAVPV